jgi:hypothetical protein
MCFSVFELELSPRNSYVGQGPFVLFTRSSMAPHECSASLSVSVPMEKNIEDG